VTKALPVMAEVDVEQLRDLGWDDEAIYYTIPVVSLFNFYNRWVTRREFILSRTKFIG